MTDNILLYALGAGLAFAISFIMTPLIREIAVRRSLLDAPATAIKTHKTPTPALGGVAIALGFFGSLAVIRLLTHFPTGTLTNLRGMLLGALLVSLTGLIDDIKKPGGLSVSTKFIVQIVAAALLIIYGIHMNFLHPLYISIALSVVWTVGVTNAFNIIDIMDGLSSSQGLIAAAGFLLIALPSEFIYVNFASAALLGGLLGFLPWNLSSKRKIFMGDSGALLVGFVLAAVSMGTNYDRANPLGVYAPLLLLAIPIYDTIFVAVMRMLRGSSPFKGSKDHYALRLEKAGLSRPQIVTFSALAAISLSMFAVLASKVSMWWALAIYLLAAAEFITLSLSIAHIKMHD